MWRGPGAEQMGFGAAWPGWIRRSSTRRWRGGRPQRLKRLVTDTSTLVSGFGWGGPLARLPTLHCAVR
jgi:hypothetical protein